MRKYPYIFLVVLLFTILACGSEAAVENADSPEENISEDLAGETEEEDANLADEQEEPTATPVPTETPEPGLSLSSPAPMGTEVSTPNFTFLVNEVTQPANDIVAAGNPFNTSPETGQEYLMVNLTVTCDTEDCEFFPTNFDVIGSAGIGYDTEFFISGVEGMLENTEMLQGGSVTGLLFFIVGQNDSNFALRWDPIFGDSVYLALGDFDPSSQANNAENLPDIEPIETSRDDPAPYGEQVATPNFIFQVMALTRPANEIVAAGNQFNTAPETGQEYISVTLAVTCRANECSFSPYNLAVIGSVAIAHDPEIFIAGVEGILEDTELLQGSSTSGDVYFLVGQDETDLVLRWEPFVGDAVFLSLEE